LPAPLPRARTIAREGSLGDEFRRRLEDANASDEFDQLRGSYHHHYPICVRTILPDDTLISMASNAGIEHRSHTDIPADLSADVAWYSITLTNYHRGQRRRQFEELAAFLAKSMSCLFDARPHWGQTVSTAKGRVARPSSSIQGFRGCLFSRRRRRCFQPSMDRFGT
jgi:hypothetical protein